MKWLFDKINKLKEDGYDGVEITETSDVVTLSTYIHYEYSEIKVKKKGAVAGWVRRNSSKNDHKINFELYPISDTRIDVNVYYHGLFAQTTFVLQDNVWEFHKPTYWSWVYEAYPYINFLDSLNQSNQLTDFIACWIDTLRACLNDSMEDVTDLTVYDNEPPCGETPKGDMIITLTEKNINAIAKFRKLKIGEEIVDINRSMVGKKIIFKDFSDGMFRPLNDDDFANCY